MATPLTVALPPNIHLVGGYTISVTAVDAVTGADVTDVQVFNVALHVEVIEGSAEDLAVGPFMLVPGPQG